MTLFESFIANLGPLVYSIPAFFLVFAIRESLRNFIFKKLFSTSSYNAFYYFDALALVSFATVNFSWGGVSQRNRKDNIISWAITLGSSILLIGFFLIYLKLNNTIAGSFLYLLIVDAIRLSYLLIITSIIPLPPFDLSFVYWQRMLENPIMQIVNVILKISIISILYFDLVEINILNTEPFIDWLGLL